MADWVSQAGRVKDRSGVRLKARLEAGLLAGFWVRQVDRLRVRIMVRLRISLFLRLPGSRLILQPRTFRPLFQIVAPQCKACVHQRWTNLVLGIFYLAKKYVVGDTTRSVP